MANIRRPVLSPDLFGDVARGVTIPYILWGTYDEIVQLVRATHGRALKRVTRKILTESLGEATSVVLKKSQMITVFVTRIDGNNVSFFLSFDDLKVLPPLIQDRVLRKVVLRARLGPKLQVELGDLVGNVTMERPINVVPLPDRDTRPWSKAKSDCAVHAEVSYLKERVHSR